MSLRDLVTGLIQQQPGFEDVTGRIDPVMVAERMNRKGLEPTPAPSPPQARGGASFGMDDDVVDDAVPMPRARPSTAPMVSFGQDDDEVDDGIPMPRARPVEAGPPMRTVTVPPPQPMPPMASPPAAEATPARGWLDTAKTIADTAMNVTTFGAHSAGQSLGEGAISGIKKIKEAYDKSPTAEKAKPPSPDDENALAGGWNSGVLGQYPKLTGAAAEGLGHIIGSENTVRVGKHLIAKGDEESKKHQPRVAGMENIRTDTVGNFFTDLGSFAGFQTGQAVASSIPSMAPAAVAGMVFKNPRIAAAVAAAPGSFIQNYGDVYSSSKEDKDIAKRVKDGEITERQLASMAIVPGLIMASLDVFSVDQLLGKKIGQEAKADLGRRFVKGMAAGALTEGSTEAVQEIVSQWAQHYFGSQTDAYQKFMSVANNFAGGFFGGGAIGGATSIPGGKGAPGVPPGTAPPGAPPAGPAPLEGEILPPEGTPPPGTTPNQSAGPVIEGEAVPVQPEGRGLPSPEQPGNTPSAPSASSAPDAVETPSNPDDALLRGYGYSDDMISAMSPEQRAVELEDARASGSQPASKSSAKISEVDFGQDDHVVGTRGAPVSVDTAADLAHAEAQVNTDPTDAQKEAGNYQKGHLKVHGLDVTIENPKGSTRSGKGPDGKAWSVEMPATYGYVKRSTGADGDQVDVYVGPNPESKHVFVFDQHDPATGKFDEHKVMLGFPGQAAAVGAYDAAFSDGSGPARRKNGPPTTMAIDKFKDWLRKGDTKKAVGGYSKTTRKQPTSEAPAPERIVGAAVIAKDGRVFIGGNHILAAGAARKSGVDISHIYEESVQTGGPPQGGFLTSNGRYVSRNEAAEIAHKAEQVGGSQEWLESAKEKGIVAEGIRTLRKESDSQLVRGWQGKTLEEISSGDPTETEVAATIKEAIDLGGIAPADVDAVAGKGAHDEVQAATSEATGQQDAPGGGQVEEPQPGTRVGEQADGTRGQDQGTDSTLSGQGNEAASEPAGGERGAQGVTFGQNDEVVEGAIDADVKSAFDDIFGAEEPAPAPKAKKKPVTPQVPNEPGTKYVLPSFATGHKPRTKADLAGSAAKGAARGTSNAIKGLGELFGGKNKIGMGVSFDPDTYAKAKPLFLEAARDFAGAWKDVAELARKLVEELKAAGYGMDVLRNMRPYLEQFVQDVKTGAIDLGKSAEGSNIKGEEPSDGTGDGAESGTLGKTGVEPSSGDVADGKPPRSRNPGNVGGEPAEDAGGAQDVPRGQGAGARPDGEVHKGGGGVPKGGDAANGRPRAGGKGVATPGAGGRPDHPSLRPNYHLTDPERLVGGGPKARFARNRKAIEAFQAITDEARDPTPEELDAMAGYMGWGSFGQELFQGTWARSRAKDGWENEDQWLRQHLGQTEWESAQGSIVNAHYTDPPTVKAIWDMVRAMGFKGGRVLEPSMGVGNFFALMPRDLMGASHLTGIELDKLTGGMARILYPQASVQIKGYQDSQTADHFYDLVVGNWPFSSVAPADRRHGKLGATLHDFFFVKALDQVRPGGLVVGITSSGTMDKLGKPVRIHLAKNAELVAAFRLPSGAFEKYAGTSVVTDIIILKKREKPVLDVTKEGWIESLDKKIGGNEIRVNDYWNTHLTNILGDLGFGHGTTQGREGMIVTRRPDFAERLAELPSRVPADAFAPIERGKEPRFITNNTADRQRSITVKDGELYQVQGDRLVVLEDVIKFATANKAETSKRKKQLIDLIDMRRAHGRLLDAERDGDQNTEKVRSELKGLYEKFTAKNGRIVGSDGISILRRAGDPFVSVLLALETPDGKPSRILSESTTRAKKKIDQPTVRDAFVIQRNKSVNLDMAAIATLSGKSVDEVAKDLIASKAIYRTPGGGYEVSDVYLSGNVRRKLREAIDALDAGDRDMVPSIEALKAVQPADLPYYKIEAKLGAPWVPIEDYKTFIAEMLGVKETAGIEVEFLNARWKVHFASRKLNDRPEATTTWGHGSYPFDKMLAAAMGNQSVTIRYKDHDGNLQVHDQHTKEVNEKITVLRENFSAWAWKSVDRRVRFERAYNDTMRAIATPKFDGSFLEFPGMVLHRGKDAFSLREHQVNAIWRGIVNRSGLYAHEVGTGKTYTMGGIAVESRRYGIARKPMILAHNANSASVAAEIQEMYPGAKVLYVDNLTPQNIDVTMQRIANDDWDAVVVPHSLIDRFGLSEKTLNAMMATDIAALEEEAMSAAAEDGSSVSVADMDDERAMARVRSPTAKQLVKQRNQIKEKIKEMAARASRDGAIKFEDLGVDMMLVDEVHEFKKPPITTKMKMRGLNTGTSGRSIALRFLTDYVKGINNGRGVHIFTGTPITNTLVEIYNMQRYVMDDVMSLDGLRDWDAWFNVFADSSTDVELTDAGEYEAVTRLASFVNVADLRMMIGQYMDIVFAKDMPEFKPRSVNGKTLASTDLTEAERDELVNGRTENAIGRPYKKIVNDMGPMSPAQEEALNRLASLAQDFKNASKRQRRDWMLSGNERNPILVGIAAAKAGLDVRLYNREAPDHPQNKAHRVVKNVLNLYKSHKLASQVIFVDQGYSDSSTRIAPGQAGVPAKDKVKIKVPQYNLVAGIVDELVKGGIPRDQIAVVDGSVSKAKRKEIADKMNTAQIRVAIGNSDTLGVGVNMQRNLRAMHHMDAPWMPGELEQRNGRGERQGNQWNTVFEYRYITEKLDGRRWQVLAVKDRFINAFLTADDSVRIIEGDAVNADEGESVSSLMETLSSAAGDPRLLLKHKFEADIKKLQGRERLHTYGVKDAQDEAGRLRDRIVQTRQFRDRIQAEVDKLHAAQADGAFHGNVAGTEYSVRDEFDDAINAAITKLSLEKDQRATVANVYGFRVVARRPVFGDDTEYWVSVGTENMTVRPSSASIEGVLRNLPKRVTDAEEKIADMTSSITRMEESAAEPFAQAKQLEAKRAQLAALEKDMSWSPAVAPSWLRQGAPVDTTIRVREGDNLVSLVVTGHRWGDADYFVLTEKREVPYLEALDENGQRIYDARPFQAPAAKPAAKPKDKPLAPDDEAQSLQRPSTLTPKARQRQADIAEQVTRLVERMTGRGIRVEFYQGTTVPTKGTDGAWGEWGEGKEAEASYLGSERLIKLAFESPNLVSNAYHESFHDIESKLLTDRERDLIVKETPRLRAVVMERYGFTEQELSGIEGSEVRAMAFEAYIYERSKGGSGATYGVHVGVRAIFEKIMRVLRAVRNLMIRGFGFKTIEDIFENSYQGKYANRTPRRSTQTSVAASVQDDALGPDGEARAVRRGPPVPASAPASFNLPVDDLTAPFSDKSLPLTERVEGKRVAFVRGLADRMIDQYNVERKIEEARGGPLPAPLRAYMAESLYYGRTAERMLDVGEEHVKPIIQELKKARLKVEDLDDFLLAMHAEERNNHIASVNPTMPDGGSGIDTADAHALMAQLTAAGKVTELQPIAAMVYDMLKEARDRRLAGGTLTPAEHLAWENQYQFYVPLRGFEKRTGLAQARTTSAGKGFSVSGKESPMALGRRSRADSPLAFAIKEAVEAVDHVERARVDRALLRLVQQHPHPELWGTPKGTMERKINPTTGLVETVFVPTDHNADNVVVAKVGGKPFPIVIYHDRLAEGWKTIGTADLGGFFRAVRAMTRFYASVRTRWNPEFITVNFLRDQFDAGLAVLTLGKGPRANAYYLKQLPKAMAGAFEVIAVGTARTAYARLYDEFRHAGGKITFAGARDVEEVKRDIVREMKNGNVKKALTLLPRMIEGLNDVFETSTRLALYATAKHYGLTRDEAASFAREGTLNFNRHGASTLNAILRAGMPFFQANVNANVRFSRLFMGAAMGVAVTKAGITAFRLALYSMIIGGFLVALFNRFNGDDDDDGVSFWDKVPEYEKERNIIIMLGKGDDRIKIPMFPEGMFVWRMGQNLADTMVKGGKGTGKALKNVFDAFVDMIPLAGSGHMMAPHFEWAANLRANLNSFGRPIYPEPFPFSKEAGLPKSQVKFPWTNSRWQTIAEIVGKGGGGDKNAKPVWLADLHPEVAKFLVEEAIGGTGAFVTGGFQAMEKLASGMKPSELDAREYPILRRYYATGTDVWSNKQFRELSETARSKTNIFGKAVSRGDDPNTLQRLGEEVGAYTGPRGGNRSKANDVVDSARRDMRPINQEIDRVRTGDLPLADRERRLRELNDQRTLIRKRTVQTLREMGLNP